MKLTKNKSKQTNMCMQDLHSRNIVLLKETAVSGYVALIDLTRAGDIVRGATYQAFMPLFGVAAVYLIMVMFFSWLLGKLERRLRNDER